MTPIKNTVIKSLVLTAVLGLMGCDFFEVDPGVYYRSEQLTASQFKDAHEKFKIKTIINLRGENKGQDWYDAESRFAEESGVELINISMSAEFIPSRENLIRLLDALKTAERPILVHCKAGVDRTGEASAIYEMLYMNKTKSEALEMLYSKYGYIDGVSPKAKKYFIETLWQGEDWARNEYDPCKSNYEYFDRSACP